MKLSTTKILLVSPKTPCTFWSFQHVLKFVRKKSAFPPLGLLTVAALLPTEWEKRLIDLDVDALKDQDLLWADFVFIGGMIIHKESMKEVLQRCKVLKRRVVAGGPFFTTGYEEFIDDVDHFVLNEAEVTLPLFLNDLQHGSTKKIYTSTQRPNISQTPIPLWHLIDMRKYSTMSVQYSRGCPFDCEFCDIVIMNGRVPRVKTNEQMAAEFDALYRAGWKGALFIVDDNFIGNKRQVKIFLPELAKWMHRHSFPFTLLTEASVNLAEDEGLLKAMVEAGFNKVFIGIETPNQESLVECSKYHNATKDLIHSIKHIQNIGLEVMGGFIVGFDNDPLDIFERQIKFIQESGIVIAMVGILGALPQTRLYNRLKKEGRLLERWKGCNTESGALNFIPKMDTEFLKKGYRTIIDTIYSPRNYYQRVLTFIREYKPPKLVFRSHKSFSHIMAFIRSLWYLGIMWKYRFYYWKLLLIGLFRYPKAFPQIVVLSIYSYHFQKIVELGAYKA